MNRTYIFGRLTANPELRYTQSSKAVCNFSIASNEGYGEKRTTEYTDCVAWEKLAEKIAEHGRKGKEIAIAGRLQTRKWEDKETGQTRRKTEVNCSNAVIGIQDEPRGVEEVDRRGREEDRGYERRPREAAVQQPLDIDDIPF